MSFYPTRRLGAAPRVASLAGMTNRPDEIDALAATELADLEALAAAMSDDEVDGVAPVQGPQEWE